MIVADFRHNYIALNHFYKEIISQFQTEFLGHLRGINMIIIIPDLKSGTRTLKIDSDIGCLYRLR